MQLFQFLLPDNSDGKACCLWLDLDLSRPSARNNALPLQQRLSRLFQLRLRVFCNNPCNFISTKVHKIFIKFSFPGLFVTVQQLIVRYTWWLHGIYPGS